MSLKDDMEDDLDDFFDTDEFAEEIVYVTGAKTISAIIDYTGDPEMSGVNSSTQASITVKKSDVPDIEVMHEFNFDGHLWIVDRIVQGDRYTMNMIVRRKEGVRFTL